ncbi:MAG TPA: hypothetical protein DCZ69_01035 [Syntrophobacteraceae bacterium]|jgi:c-di-GMP-binding flagellar brake protein YcgR|nr:hypothetical protein [Syntrophobacteraceae bacterium]HBD06819.1 hypothetical protein [Syntrophobacteraceae bacterium]HBZ55648.1 hypothetical protein [Syntrophobacteraceae bacterium]
MILNVVPDSAERNTVLHVELGARFLVTLEGMERNLWSTLIGIELGKYLIIRTPQVEGIDSILTKDKSIQVTYFFSGTVYGFHSTVLEHIRVPSALLFIAFPTEIKKIELREHPRIDCCLPGKLIVDDARNNGMVLDLSAAGCRFSMLYSELGRFPQIEVSDHLELEFAIPGSDIPKRLPGLVKNIIKDSKKMNVGIHFDRVDAHVLFDLDNYIKETLYFSELLEK